MSKTTYLNQNAGWLFKNSLMLHQRCFSCGHRTSKCAFSFHLKTKNKKLSRVKKFSCFHIAEKCHKKHGPKERNLRLKASVWLSTVPRNTVLCCLILMDDAEAIIELSWHTI